MPEFHEREESQRVWKAEVLAGERPPPPPEPAAA